MKKGDLVRIKKDSYQPRWHGPAYYRAFRSTTQEERDEWRQDLTKDIKAGQSVWHDSAGESKLPPQSKSFDLLEGKTFIVLKARAHARVGWGNGVPKCTYIMCPELGEKLYVHRKDLEVVSLS
jgi:hypothetical protein